VNVPGFRKGKAPYDVIVQRFGEETVRREAADLLGDEVYPKALDQEEIEPYGPGVLNELLLDPITFKLTLPLLPAVDLGDYASFRLKHRKARVYKKEIAEALEKIRQDHAFLEPAKRPAALDDGVVLDLAAQATDGVEVLKADDVHMILEPESVEPAPGFAEAVVGMQVDEIRVFALNLTADFPQQPYQGQPAEFTVRLKEVYDNIVPELDDDLARAAGNFDSLKKLEAHVKDQIRQASQAEADREYAEKVVEAIVEQARVEYPRVMLEEELDSVVKEAEQSLKREGGLAMEDYLRIKGQSMDELREDLSPRAAARLKHRLTLREVVAAEGLELDEGEIDTLIDDVSAPWGTRADEVRASLQTDEGRQRMRSRLLGSKAVDRLVAIAKGEKPEPAEEEAPDEKEAAEKIEETSEADASEEVEEKD
jgi:trigger factor